MPRRHIRKPDSRKYGYDVAAMQAAISDVNEKGLSVKKAAFLHQLNRTTLRRHLNNISTGKVGRPSVLTRAEESLIVHALQKLGDWGFGLDRPAVQSIVQEYLINAGKPNPFKDGKPGIEWLYGFEGRWRNEMTRRIGQPLPASRAYACNKVVVDDFFGKLNAAIDRLNIRNKPQNIFNVDETGFQTDIGDQKIFCKRGLRNPHKTVASSTKTMFTVQVCCSAVGQFLPLYVVFKGLHLYSTWCSGGPESARCTCSPSGWMESLQFLEWFSKMFVESSKELDGGKLLIFDGHSSHLSEQVVSIAEANNVELLCLPAHTSSIVQLLDVGVFKSVKTAWRKLLRTFYDETRYSNVDKKQFPKLLKELDDGGAFSRTNAINAFEACGIYPPNRDKISEEKLSTSVPLTKAPESSSSQTSKETSHPSDEPPVQEAMVTSPRKRLEAALINHLRHVTPTGKDDKRKRLKRTLAESLTSKECHQRLAEMEAANKTNSTKKKLPQKTVNVSTETSATVGKKTFQNSQSKMAVRRTQNKSQGDMHEEVLNESENMKPCAKKRSSKRKLSTVALPAAKKRNKVKSMFCEETMSSLADKASKEAVCKRSRRPRLHVRSKSYAASAVKNIPIRKPIWLKTQMNVGSPVHNGNISVKSMSVEVGNELAMSASVEKESSSAEMVAVEKEIESAVSASVRTESMFFL